MRILKSGVLQSSVKPMLQLPCILVVVLWILLNWLLYEIAVWSLGLKFKTKIKGKQYVKLVIRGVASAIKKAMGPLYRLRHPRRRAGKVRDGLEQGVYQEY